LSTPPPPLGGGTPPTALAAVRLCRGFMTRVTVAGSVAGSKSTVPGIREEMIEALVKAVAETEQLAKGSSTTSQKGEGGVPGKARWYQLMGYLVQVLDGVMRNVEISEFNDRLLRVEAMIGPQSERRTQVKAAGKASN